MKIFIWQNLDEVSESYHKNGGLMVVAESLERAKEIAVFKKGYGENQTDVQIKIDKDPDFYAAVSTTEEKMMVFENAGCC